MKVAAWADEAAGPTPRRAGLHLSNDLIRSNTEPKMLQVLVINLSCCCVMNVVLPTLYVQTSARALNNCVSKILTNKDIIWKINNGCVQCAQFHTIIFKYCFSPIRIILSRKFSGTKLTILDTNEKVNQIK